MKCKLPPEFESGVSSLAILVYDDPLSNKVPGECFLINQATLQQNMLPEDSIPLKAEYAVKG